MKKALKKLIASTLAVSTIAISAISVNAASVGSINLYKYAGAPGSATQTSQEWNFTTASSTTYMGISKFTRDGSDSYVYLYSSTGVSAIFTGTGSRTATNVKIGESAYASASLNNFDSGNHHASGSVTG